MEFTREDQLERLAAFKCFADALPDLPGTWHIVPFVLVIMSPQDLEEAAEVLEKAGFTFQDLFQGKTEESPYTHHVWAQDGQEVTLSVEA